MEALSMKKATQWIFLILLLFLTGAFVTAGMLTYTNPTEAFKPKYAGWFNSYFYSDFFVFIFLGIILLGTYRAGIIIIQELVKT